MLNTFKNNFEKSLAYIQSVLDTPEDAYNYEQALLANWMLNSGVNPYEYLPLEWAGSLSCASHFEMLLRTLHHSLYDDGDISFITVDGSPRIVFICHSDDNFREKALRLQERYKEIEFLPLDVQTFIDTKVKYEKRIQERREARQARMDKV